MTEENRENAELDLFVEESEENATIEMPSELQNGSEITNDMDDDEKDATAETESCEEEKPEKSSEIEPAEAEIRVLDELAALKEETAAVLTAVTKLQNGIRASDKIFEEYKQNLSDVKATFDSFENQLPQLVPQLRGEIKTSYKDTIEEAVMNYKNLKAAIAKDINNAINTWNKVREVNKDIKRIESFLRFSILLQTVLVILFVLEVFVWKN